MPAIKLKSKVAKQLTLNIEKLQKTVVAILDGKATTAAEQIKLAAGNTSSEGATAINASISMGDQIKSLKMEDTKEVVEIHAEENSEIAGGQVESVEMNGTKENIEFESTDKSEGTKVGTDIVAAKKEKKVRGVETIHVSKTSKPLEDGVYIVRALGKGKYETINLENIRLRTLRSEGAGLGLDNNLERANSFFLGGYQWADYIVKCALASRYSNKHIFRFLGLPLELRYKVYELVTIAKDGVGPRVPFEYRSKPSACIQMLHICQDIRKEAHMFFFKNNFFVQGNSGEFSKNMPLSLTDHLRELTFEWNGRGKEVSWIAQIGKLPNLKIFHVTVGHLLCRVHHRPPIKPNKSYQDDETIKKFSVAPGFDKLILIRGLDWATFSSSLGEYYGVDDADVKAFEEFLNKVLTLPKPNPVVKRVRKPRVRKAIATTVQQPTT